MSFLKQTKSKILLGILLLSFCLLFIPSISGLDDDYHRGNSYESRTYGPYEFLAPFIEKVGPISIEPKFTIGPTGTVSMVYADYDDHAVYYMDNATGEWSTPHKLFDENYINFEEHAITTDAAGNIYILGDGAVGKFITNRSGTWVDSDFNMDHFSYNIKTNDAGDKVYIVTTELDTDPTPADHEIIYINLTYSDPTTYTLTSTHIDFNDAEPYDTIYFTDMDVNSTGHVHIVYKGFTEIYHFVINPDGTYTTPQAISQTNGEVRSWCNWPSMAIDENDNVHVIYTRYNYDSSNQSIVSETGLYYDIVNATTDGSQAVKLSRGSGGLAHITTGVGDDTVHVGSYQSFDQVCQIEYLTDKSGAWESEFLTNFSYSQYRQGMSVRGIDVNPVTNEPVIHTRYSGHMELISMKGARWGHRFGFKAELASLATQYPDNLQLTMEVSNIDDRTIDLDTIAQINCMAEVEFENIEGNQQDVGVIAWDSSITLNWDMHFTGKYEEQIHVSLLVNENIDDRGYAGVYWDVAVTLSIPGYSIWVLGLATIVTVGVLFKKYKK